MDIHGAGGGGGAKSGAGAAGATGDKLMWVPTAQGGADPAAYGGTVTLVLGAKAMRPLQVGGPPCCVSSHLQGLPACSGACVQRPLLQQGSWWFARFAAARAGVAPVCGCPTVLTVYLCTAGTLLTLLYLLPCGANNRWQRWQPGCAHWPRMAVLWESLKAHRAVRLKGLLRYGLVQIPSPLSLSVRRP